MGTSAITGINLGSPAYIQDITVGGSAIALNHNLNSQYVSVTIYDNNGKIVIPDDVTATSTTVATLDISSYGTISGTWRAVVVDTGATWNGNASGLDISGQTTGDLLYYNGSSWVRFAPGTSGDVITSTGAASLPTYQTPASADTNDAVAFRAFSTGTISLNDNTVVYFTCDSETFDTKGYYNTGTYRFTPLVAGLYYIEASWQMTNDGAWAASTRMITTIVRNGSGAVSQIKNNVSGALQSGFHYNNVAAGFVEMNGTTDYIEAYAYQTQFGASTEQGDNMVLSGCLIR